MADLTPPPPTPGSTPKPTNGASSPAQPPAPPAEAPEVLEAKRVMSEAEALRASVEKAKRVHAAETKKIGAKLSEYEQLKKWKTEQERLESQAKLNKSAYLRAKFGDDWYEQILQEKANGGAPTADTVAYEVERVREEFSKKFEEHTKSQQEAQQRAQEEQVQASLRAFGDEAVSFAKANLKDYPIFERLGGEEQVGAAIVARIRAEHDRSLKRDEEGRVISKGKVLTMKEAADAIEADLIAIAESAVGHDKYKPRLTEKFKPVSTVPRGTEAPVGGPRLGRTEERRTLSNDLTGATPGRQPPRTDAERRERALAVYNATRAKASTQ